MCEGIQSEKFLISRTLLVFCTGAQRDLHFSWKVVKCQDFDVEKTHKMLNDKLEGCRHHSWKKLLNDMLPAFNDTIALALPLYTCSAVAGTAIQGTQYLPACSTLRTFGVKVLPLLLTAGLPSSAELPN